MAAYTGQIIALIICLGFSAFFSMSETALMSISKIKIRHMVEEGNKDYKALEKLLDNPSKLIGGILIGNNIANIGGSSIATAIAIKAMGEGSVALSTAMMTILVLIFGEITPKSLAKENSEKISLIVVKPIQIIVKVLTPLVFVFTNISGLFIKLLGGENKENEPFITEEELKTMVGVSEEEGILENEEKKFIFNVFEFGDTQVKDVMVQRLNLVAIDVNSRYDEVFKLIEAEHFTRIPVYENNIDNIIGVLHIKDLFINKAYLSEGKKFDIKDHIREINYTFEYKKIIELFSQMKKSRNHMSVVIDEYGGTVGIVTIEDLIEELVGEIDDEYDIQREDNIIKINDNEYIVNAQTRLEDLSDILDLKIRSEEFDSIGGFILGQKGSLPKVKDEIYYKNIIFRVESVNKHSVKKIRVFLDRKDDNI